MNRITTGNFISGAVLVIIDTKLFKSKNVISPKKKIPTNVCILNFVNRDMEDINVSKIFQTKDVIDSLHLISKTMKTSL